MGLGDLTDPLDEALEVGRADGPPILIDIVVGLGCAVANATPGSFAANYGLFAASAQLGNLQLT